MTDLEKIELAIRRVASKAGDPLGYWFTMLADQIVEDELERRMVEAKEEAWRG